MQNSNILFPTKSNLSIPNLFSGYRLTLFLLYHYLPALQQKQNVYNSYMNLSASVPLRLLRLNFLNSAVKPNGLYGLKAYDPKADRNKSSILTVSINENVKTSRIFTK